jgi:hypothetical protein
MDPWRRMFRSPPAAAIMRARSSSTEGNLVDASTASGAAMGEGLGSGAGEGAASAVRIGHRSFPASPIFVSEVGEMLATSANPTFSSGMKLTSALIPREPPLCSTTVWPFHS